MTVVVKPKDSISDTLRAMHTAAASPRPRSRIAQPQATSDEMLMAQIAGGDRLAMAALYARHHVRVFRFVLRLVQDESTAEDLTAEVLFDVWRHADRFERRSAVSTWMLGIARFKALSALRRRPAENLDEQAAKAIEDPAGDPATELEKKDTSTVIRKCLTELPAQHREIIDLVYYHEKSLEEVAEIVGIPKNTVKTRMLRARARLAKLLKRAGIERD
jgi:RNA polymerase sigma-70 factor (ECF subfamily)